MVDMRLILQYPIDLESKLDLPRKDWTKLDAFRNQTLFILFDVLLLSLLPCFQLKSGQ
jgi:hypothetical protein